MSQEVRNYARFYVVFNKMRCPGDREELKCDLVRQVTNGRTESLREVTRREYEELCSSLEQRVPAAVSSGEYMWNLRRQRSIALHQMQKMGVDTTDWARINALCQDYRIAGKVFARLSPDELAALTKKLRVIERKGGFRMSCVEQGTVAEPSAKIVSINEYTNLKQ